MPTLRQSLKSSRAPLVYLAVFVVLEVIAAHWDLAVADSTIAQNDVFVEIVNYHQSSEYRITFSDGSPKMTILKSPSDGRDDPLARIMSSISSTRSSQRQAAASLAAHLDQPIRWANLSPDGRFVLAGFEDPSFGAMKSATLYRATDLVPIMRISSEGRIRSSLWSDDSESLTILESTERMKKTLWGMLAAISGHPIELTAFYARRVDIATRSNVRVNIADGIENGEAELRAKPPTQ